MAKKTYLRCANQDCGFPAEEGSKFCGTDECLSSSAADPVRETTLERFDQWCDVTHGHAMSKHPKGLFVRYADVEPLLNQTPHYTISADKRRLSCVDGEFIRADVEPVIRQMQALKAKIQEAIERSCACETCAADLRGTLLSSLPGEKGT